MSLLTSMKIVACAYGDKYGVKVIPANKASTDGSTIKTVIDESNPKASWGFLTHESAHIKKTDFSQIKSELLQNHIDSNDLLKPCFTVKDLFSIINALEDSRIETCFFTEYLGTFNTFNEMNQMLIDEGKWVFVETKEPIKAVSSFIHYYAAGALEGMAYPSCQSLSDCVSNNLKALVTGSIFEKVKKISLDSLVANDTREIVLLSLEVLLIMRELHVEKEGNKKNGISQIPTPTIEDKGGLTAEVLNSSKTAEYISDNSCNRDDELNRTSNKNDFYEKGVVSSGKLIRRIDNLVQAKSRGSIALKRSGRKLCRRRLASISSGATNVFRKKIEGTSSSTAIYISGDISSSMNITFSNENVTRGEVALGAISALSYAIDKTKGSEAAVSVFNNGVYLIKSFGDAQQKVKKEISDIRCSGGTRLMPVLWNGLLEFSKVKHKYNRMVMLIVTDGEPSDLDASIERIAECRKVGIELYGIGIAMSETAIKKMTDLFGNSFIGIDSSSELQNKVMELAKFTL